MESFPAVASASAAGVVVALLALWLVSLRLRDASIIDIFWAPGFALIAWIGFAVGDGARPRSWLLCALVSAWALRLGTYLYQRNAGHGEDRRYQAMRRRHGDRFGIVSLYTVFALQGALMWIVSLPVQIALASPTPERLGWIDAAGCALWICGFAFEAIGDAQLARFKADPENDQAVMDRGLWSWTRHPNYFGNCVMWWGIFLVAASTPYGALGAIGPLVMTYLLLKVSGVALLERGLRRRRPGYEEYISRTSAFFPRPPRRSQS